MDLTRFLDFNSLISIGIIIANYFIWKKFKYPDREYLSLCEFHNGVKYFHTEKKMGECKYIYKVDNFEMVKINNILSIKSFTNKKIKMKSNQIYHTIKDRSEKDFDQIYGIIIRDCFVNFIEISKNRNIENKVYLYIEI